MIYSDLQSSKWAIITIIARVVFPPSFNSTNKSSEARVLPSPWVLYQSLPCSRCWRVPHPTPRGPGCTPHWTNTALSSCWGSWPGAWGPGQVCPQTWWSWGQEHYHVLHSNSHATTILHCQYTTSVDFLIIFLKKKKCDKRLQSESHPIWAHGVCTRAENSTMLKQSIITIMS